MGMGQAIFVKIYDFCNVYYKIDEFLDFDALGRLAAPRATAIAGANGILWPHVEGLPVP